MSIEQLIQNYGYLALFVGTFLEGETILVMAGFAAHRGYLSLTGVILVAFAGSLFGDQLYFFIGRLKGRAFLERRPTWKHRSDRAQALLERWHTGLILGFRFLYGLRTVTPFIIGLSEVGAAKFAALNALGAIVWAVAFALGGYYFGSVLEALLEDLKKYELALIALIGGVGLVYWLYRLRRKE